MTAIPLTVAQQGVWFAQQLDPTSTAFVTAERIAIRGPIDDELLAGAIRGAVDEAQGLHVRVVEDGGEPWLQESPPGEWPLPCIDLRDQHDPRAVADRWTDEALARPIDPATDRLFDEALLRVGDQEILWLQRVHHLATDAVGLSLLGRRAAELYTAAVCGEQPPAAWFPSPADLLAAEHAYRESSAAGRDSAFWSERWPSVAALPASMTDRPGGVVRGVQRASVPLAAGTLDAVRAAAERAGTSWPEVVIAAAGAYVGRFTTPARPDDEAPPVVLGIPLASRHGPVGLRSVATLVNILPLAVPRDGEPAALIAAVGRELRQLRRHQRHRGELLRRATGTLGADRPLYGPLVNVLPFDYALRFGEAAATVETLAAGPVDDLSFNVYDRGDSAARLDVEGNRDRYDAGDVELHAARFVAFLHRFATADETPVAALDLLASGERERVIETVNATDHERPETTLSALIAATIAARPSDVALRFDGASLTYAELSERAAPVTAALRRAGAGPGAVVAVAVPRSLELLIALVAVLDSGAAYLPLDPEYPAGRLTMMLEDAAPVAAIVDGTLTDLVAWPTGLPLLDPRDPGKRDEWVADGPAAGPGDPAYVIFTSGSTGRPKGVVVSHRAIVNRLLWMQHAFAIGPRDRVLQKTPVGFDVSVWELFWPLIAGVPLVIAPPGLHRDPLGLATLIDAEQVTTAHFVPSMLALFVDDPAVGRCPSLRRVICSGEALAGDLRDRFFTRFGAELHNLYGPTEAAVDVTHWPCAAGEGLGEGPGEGVTVPIGRPIWNTRTYVLDGERRPLPIGAGGELYLAGVQLADGYLGRPDLTAAAFVDDPFHPGERMYRTGDLARWRGDGALDYLGRADDQVKIRGQRIETAEIEARLHEQPGVARAAVIADDRAPGGPRLVAYVVAAGAPLDPDRLRDALARTLSDAMVPSAFVAVPELPLTPSGKLDRRALPEATIPQPGARHRLPATPDEEVVCTIFADVLGVAEIGADDDFFGAGGHSLIAAVAAARIRDAFGVPATIGSVFAAPTPAALARRLRDGGGDALEVVLRLRDGDGAPLFCVHPAGGIGWCYATLARTLAPGSAVYALQARGLDGRPAPAPASIRELARDYLREIRGVRPEGPYRLLGWSVGGVIAHELAVLLGDEVEQLVILDAYPGEQWRDLVPPTPEEALIGVLNLGGVGPDALDGRAPTRELVRGALRARGSALGQLGDATVTAVIDTVLRSARLMREHEHGTFAGDAELFVAGAPRPETWLDPSGWEAHLGGRLTIHELDCTHPELVQPEASRRIAATLAPREWSPA